MAATWDSENLLGGGGNPRGTDGLSAGEDLGEEEADQVEADPVYSGGPRGGEDDILDGSDLGLRQRRHHDPSDYGCPMGGGDLGIWRSGSGSCRLTSNRLVLTGRRQIKVG